MLFTDRFRLEKMGALERSKVVKDNEKWRLVTSMWLHAGLVHLVVNMFNVVFIGYRLEQQFGFSNSLLHTSFSCILFIGHSYVIQTCLVIMQ